MSEAKNTPGPWTSSLMNQHSEYPPIILISGGDGNIVCEISDICVNDADLSFMLAAPDMYAALEEMVALVCDSCLEYERFKELCYGRHKVVIAENPCNNCTNKVIKALRKARGEEE